MVKNDEVFVVAVETEDLKKSVAKDLEKEDRSIASIIKQQSGETERSSGQ